MIRPALAGAVAGIDEIKLVPPPNSAKPYGRLDARDPLTGKLGGHPLRHAVEQRADHCRRAGVYR